MLFLLLSLNLLNSAQALDLPEFSFSPAPLSRSADPLFDRTRVKNFRVQIFPHRGTYTTPQGRESTISSVKITSAAPCVGYQAIRDADQEWTKGLATNESASSLTFRAGAERSAYYSCSKPFVVNRTAPLTSINYSGDFVVIVTAAKVEVINVIDPDTYIKGVIPTEVEASWPMETLKAQAIAARTYAWWSVLKTRSSDPTNDSDMDDTVSFQAYMGNTKRAVSSDQASDATEGLVMLYNGEVIKAYFSADSGGYTEDAFEVFEDFPYCKAKPETYDLAGWPASSWTKAITRANLKTALAGVLPTGVGLLDVVVKDGDRTASGRARTVTIFGSNGQTYTMSGADFRYATKVRSNLFSVAVSGDTFTFTGKGYGHGVGMAQIGALQYVKQLGWTYDQILNFYYSDVTIEHD
jgi:stage II sporulation protein D